MSLRSAQGKPSSLKLSKKPAVVTPPLPSWSRLPFAFTPQKPSDIAAQRNCPSCLRCNHKRFAPKALRRTWQDEPTAERADCAYNGGRGGQSGGRFSSAQTPHQDGHKDKPEEIP